MKACAKNKDAPGLALANALKLKKQEAIRNMPVHYTVTFAKKKDATGLGFGNGSSLELLKREAIEKGRQAKLVLRRIDTMLMYEGSNR